MSSAAARFQGSVAIKFPTFRVTKGTPTADCDVFQLLAKTFLTAGTLNLRTPLLALCPTKMAYFGLNSFPPTDKKK